MPTIPLKKDKKCTPRQLKFVEEYARNGMDVIAAYKTAFTSKNDDTAYTEGSRLLRLPWIEKELKKHKTTLERRAARLGMNDEALLKQHRKLIFARKKIYSKEGDLLDEVDDYVSIKSGLELIYKLLGKFAADRKELTGPGGEPLFPETDFTKMSKDELEEKRDKLLKALQGIE